MQYLKNYFKNYQLHNWVGLVGLIFYTITIGFLFSNFIDYAQNDAWKIFFGIFDRFTWQSNILLFIYMFLYLIKPHHQIFKNNRFLILTMTYIFFTFFGYNVVLVMIAKIPGYTGHWFAILKNFWIHILCPLWFIFYGYTFMMANKSQEPDIIKTIVYGMIYPVLYAIYLITIPYLFSQYRLEEFAKYYNNENLEAYSVYGGATNTYKSSIAYVYIFSMLLVFYPASFCLFTYSWKGLNKLNH